ncbi:MAG: radical SAM family heme chaperone HemW [Clostridia bacterium]|nr:radical SAM family heme chaperone HemW [Clostridia bacterium]
MQKEKLGIYVHIPFCKSKCGYCDFCSHPPKKGEADRYLNALMLNMQDFSGAAQDFSVDTVYIGGGTPTLLTKKQMKDLVECIYSSFNVEKGAEFTVEANPGTVDKGYLKHLASLGINRISFGLQSASDIELRTLGRIHFAKDFIESFKAARAAGFTNISVDLMYGIPYQTLESFEKTLELVKSLRPEHISVYGLKIEEGTRFFEEQDTLPLPDEETEYKMYRTAHSLLEGAGYEHYEISNYARAGFASKHNLRYWNNEKYLGFGVSAHSYFSAQRFAFTKDIEKYMCEMEKSEPNIQSILSECNDIDIFTRESEYVMLRMRLFKGVNLAQYYSTFGEDFAKKYGEKLARYINGGFVTLDDKKCAFTLKGMYVSNYILSDILDF